MIKEHFKIHDKHQFEIKFDYELDKKKSKLNYKIDTYIFIPKSLDIHKSTYNKNDFYNDIQSYIRFKTPVFLLSQISRIDDSPITKINLVIEKLLINPSKKNINDFEYQMKMLCCIFKSSIRDHIKFIRSKTNPNDITELIDQYIKHTHKIILDFRKLRKKINVPIIKKNTFSVFLFADEYISLLIEKANFELLELIDNNPDVSLDKIKSILHKFIENDVFYRQENNYNSIAKVNDDNESLIFRFSILKKYFESVLFLNVNKSNEGKVLEQLLLGIAAGLSMIFATAIAFWGHFKYGNYTMQIFIIFVISYIFKDRIKELSRIFFQNMIFNSLYDHKINIFIDKINRIGIFKENFHFSKCQNLPKDVKEIRYKTKTQEFDNKFSEENIIVYQKNIHLFPKIYKKIFHDYKIEGINDIFRFNVSKLLYKMDNPSKQIFILDSKGYKKIFGKRVYHLNMIIKYSANQNIRYNHFRIILTKKGIKRIEFVA